MLLKSRLNLASVTELDCKFDIVQIRVYLVILGSTVDYTKQIIKDRFPAVKIRIGSYILVPSIKQSYTST